MMIPARAWVWSLVAVLGFGILQGAEERGKEEGWTETSVVMDPTGEVQKAEFQIGRFSIEPEGVLVLLDGENMPADRFFEDADWRAYAKQANLAIVGAHFESEESLLRQSRGYYSPSESAGPILIEALKKAGLGGKPILLFGFSGGARFVNHFVNSHANDVAAWAAFSASEWLAPASSVVTSEYPPGVIACGEFDAARYAPSLSFAQSLRRRSLPVVWISLKEWEHRRSVPLETFVRQFFSEALNTKAVPVVVDNVNKQEIENPWQPTLTSVLPSRALYSSWQDLHHP